MNLAEEGQEIVANLKHLALKPHPCYRDGNQVDPVNLYHKVGHGKLDMYVISPARDSQAVKDFLSKWSANDNQLFSNTGKKTGGKGFDFPIQNLVSICALLVWQPANPNDTITRILFPGSTPQHKIFEGLDKLRHLEFLKHPVCSARSISPSASAVTVARSQSKTRQAEERFKPKTADIAQKDKKPAVDLAAKVRSTKQVKPPEKSIKQKPDTNKLIEEKKEGEKITEEEKLEGIKKLEDKIYDKDEKIENITKEIQKIRQESAVQRIDADIKKIDQNEEDGEKQVKKIIHRSKYDMRNVKSKVDSRAPSKSIDRRKTQEKKTENGSPQITPKKSLVNGTATRTEKSRSLSRTSRSSPSATPGKSVKEANNRKVVEARVISRATKAPLKTAKKEETPPPASAPAAVPSVPPTLPAKTERKPISRRPKAASPAKKAAVSPVRAVKQKPGKPEVDTAVKKVKGRLATNLEKSDSTVPTSLPDVDPTIANKDLMKLATESAKVAQEAKTDLEDMTQAEANKVDMKNLTENKETDEEAVKGSETKSPKESVIEIEMKEEARDEEEEEYLIITKEEPVRIEEVDREDSQQEDVKTRDETEGEGEIKKIHQDEEDSEKKRKLREGEAVAGEEEEKESKKVETEGEGEHGEKESEIDEKENYEKEEVEEKLKEEKEIEVTKDMEVLPQEKEEKSDESPKTSKKEAKDSELQKLTDQDEGIDLKEPGIIQFKQILYLF